MTERLQARGQYVSLGDVVEAYAGWPTPTTIVSDGAYGVRGFHGDTTGPEGLGEWYRRHVEAWSAAAHPSMGTTRAGWGAYWKRARGPTTDRGWTASSHPRRRLARWAHRNRGSGGQVLPLGQGAGEDVPPRGSLPKPLSWADLRPADEGEEDPGGPASFLVSGFLDGARPTGWREWIVAMCTVLAQIVVGVDHWRAERPRRAGANWAIAGGQVLVAWGLATEAPSVSAPTVGERNLVRTLAEVVAPLAQLPITIIWGTRHPRRLAMPSVLFGVWHVLVPVIRTGRAVQKRRPRMVAGCGLMAAGWAARLWAVAGEPLGSGSVEGPGRGVIGGRSGSIAGLGEGGSTG